MPDNYVPVFEINWNNKKGVVLINYQYIEKNIKNNDKINLIASDFIPINDDIYYMIVSSFSDGENEIRRNEFLYVEDNNLYIFEYTYPYADRELDDFYLNVIRSLKIVVPKYIVENGSYRLNNE